MLWLPYLQLGSTSCRTKDGGGHYHRAQSDSCVSLCMLGTLVNPHSSILYVTTGFSYVMLCSNDAQYVDNHLLVKQHNAPVCQSKYGIFLN